MSIITILETILIGPLKLMFEVIFSLSNRVVNNPGLAIVLLSLVMNILVLPLYRRADAMQEHARDVEAQLSKGVAHINKTFSGDERMMILQTYYRQNHYKPTDALKGSVSLLLEIPFFMAAYQFLSHLSLLNGVSFGPIADLGAPDGMLIIGSTAINVLPILMTVVNIVSSTLYLKGFPLKSKIQLYAMALFFLVFLYNSPACLVFYWTLNNVFSLFKNIFYKLRNPKKVLRISLAALGAVILLYAGLLYTLESTKVRILLIGVGFALLAPMISSITIKKREIPFWKKYFMESDKRVFIMGSLFLTLLVGMQIPSTFIAASPQEYVDVKHFFNPVWYVIASAATSAGLFLVWLRVFYWLASSTGKAVLDKLVWIACGAMFVNYMFFGTDLGIINANLQYEDGFSFNRTSQFLNLIVTLALSIVLFLVINKWKKLPSKILPIAITALIVMSSLNMVTIHSSIKNLDTVAKDNQNEQFNIPLSRTEKNVVVIMLDRAIGHYIPFIMEEKPDLKTRFDGFSYYSNTISHGAYTNFATPSLFGGYEYTPVELNRRSEELLVNKHNEALKVLPKIFAEHGKRVTLGNLPYANYSWKPDLTIFEDIENCRAYSAQVSIYSIEDKQSSINSTMRNFFVFGMMKSLPLLLQPTLYNNGLYLQLNNVGSQVIRDHSHATGVTHDFMNRFGLLSSLSDITWFTDDDRGSLLLMNNEVTHDPIMLQLPEYIPASEVDNSSYSELLETKVSADGKVLSMHSDNAIIHYQTNMAAMIQLGKWFDFLRKNDVYDNTRIIVVSDHGRSTEQQKNLFHAVDGFDINAESYSALLLVKDFNASGYSTDETFMTIADVPTLASANIIKNPVNPFTGNPIDDEEKMNHRQYIIVSDLWDTAKNNGNTFLPAQWLSVKDNYWDARNWEFYETETVLAEHQFP